MKLVRHKVTGEHLALKMLVKSDLLQMSQAVHVRAERSILSELDHPYIIRMCAPPYLIHRNKCAVMPSAPHLGSRNNEGECEET